MLFEYLTFFYDLLNIEMRRMLVIQRIATYHIRIKLTIHTIFQKFKSQAKNLSVSKALVMLVVLIDHIVNTD